MKPGQTNRKRVFQRMIWLKGWISAKRGEFLLAPTPYKRWVLKTHLHLFPKFQLRRKGRLLQNFGLSLFHSFLVKPSHHRGKYGSIMVFWFDGRLELQLQSRRLSVVGIQRVAMFSLAIEDWRSLVYTQGYSAHEKDWNLIYNLKYLYLDFILGISGGSKWETSLLPFRLWLRSIIRS
jgi:hypothetical protein